MTGASDVRCGGTIPSLYNTLGGPEEKNKGDIQEI
jgi:hypothetical protein